MTLSLEPHFDKSSSRSIAVVGSGASAILLLARLARKVSAVNSPLDIYLIDQNAGNQVGIAYTTDQPLFLLNVPAANMGVDPETPGGFFTWLVNHKQRWRQLHPSFAQHNIEPQDFVPRMIYAEYLRSTLETTQLQLAEKNIQLHFLPARVTGIEAIEQSNQLQLHTDITFQLLANTVVLCTGNSTLNQPDTSNSHAFSPYSETFFNQDWQTIKDIAILGSGLCMVDAIQYLLAKGYKGNIHTFSRQGLFPLAHSSSSTPTKAPHYDISASTSATATLKILRRNIARNAANGIPWQETINSLRQQSNRLWLSLNQKERQKLQRLMPWWNVARHRIAEPIHEDLKKLQRAGKLNLIKGKVKKAESDGEYVLAHMDNKIIFIRAEKLIICTGYACNYPQLQLLCDKLLSIPDLQNKLNCDQPDYKVSATHEIYALGPALTGVLFETTAIHEIRQQSAAIADALIKQLNVVAEKQAG